MVKKRKVLVEFEKQEVASLVTTEVGNRQRGIM